MVVVHIVLLLQKKLEKEKINLYLHILNIRIQLLFQYIKYYSFTICQIKQEKIFTFFFIHLNFLFIQTYKKIFFFIIIFFHLSFHSFQFSLLLDNVFIPIFINNLPLYGPMLMASLLVPFPFFFTLLFSLFPPFLLCFTQILSFMRFG